jgi:hypothetical protein
MKLIMRCHQCSKELKPREEVLVELNETGLYQYTCSKGHKSEVALQNALFEVLFDIGAMALLDGYTREAVVSFSSALERFYEYYITAISLEAGIKGELLDDAWKKMSQQSERQYGGFITLYVHKNRKLPPALSNTDFEFRNNVVHKGKIPTTEEAISYGEKVYELISSMALGLKQISPQAVSLANRRRNDLSLGSRKNDVGLTGMSIKTIIDMAYGNNSVTEFQTFREELASFKVNLWILYKKKQLTMASS